MKIKNIIVSQPQPQNYEKSPYFELAKKHNLNIVFHKFFRIEGLSPQEFRRSRISITDHSAIIFTCNNAVDHFFRLCREMRIVVPETTKYFCVSEKTAFYLQKYVQFRKRKIFNGKENPEELLCIIKKHPQEKFLLPCTEDHKQEFLNILTESKIPYQKAVIYKTLPNDLSTIKLSDFDIIALFSHFGVKSLFSSYPEYKQAKTIIATWGTTTLKEAQDQGLDVGISGPSDIHTSMPMAIEHFIERNKK